MTDHAVDIRRQRSRRVLSARRPRVRFLLLGVLAALTAVANPIAGSSATASPGLLPAIRLGVSTVLPPRESLDSNVADTLAAASVRTPGCTATWIRTSLVTATHCFPGSEYSSTGDIAIAGAAVEWADPEVIPDGAQVFMIAFPRSAPGPQNFVLASLGLHVLQNGQTVLMAVGSGTPCGPGSSGAVGWLTVDNVLTPIGPLSVYSVDPKVTGLPSGQFVCGFAVAGV